MFTVIYLLIYERKNKKNFFYLCRRRSLAAHCTRDGVKLENQTDKINKKKKFFLKDKKNSLTTLL